jgi:NADPH:quinone reductase-like Zn-dependent oxidoreductase
MKAAQINSFGDASVIAINDIDKPTINDDQILVKVSASSINPFDNAMIAGAIASLSEQFPLTPGLDVAGSVEEIGANVTGFAVGDRVYGSANIMGGGGGGFAEYTIVNPGRIARSPSNLSDQEAASLPTAGITALQSLVDNGHVADGQKVFINGGSGGVGSLAIQIAKAYGAYVAATTSTDNLDFVKTLGADEVIDYTVAGATDNLHDYDVVFDTARADKDAVLKVVKDGGIAVSATGAFDEAAAAARGITAVGIYADVSTKSLNELAALVNDGKVKPAIAETFALDDLHDALAHKAGGSTQGKIVITMV